MCEIMATILLRNCKCGTQSDAPTSDVKKNRFEVNKVSDVEIACMAERT